MPDGNRVAGVELSNPDRILYPERGFTKKGLAEYYCQVRDLILPYVVHRPLTLVRCPQGHHNKCFYQKNFNETLPPFIRGIPVGEKEGEEGIYLAIDDLSGLISLVQLGVLEIHPWGSREDRLDRPDQVIFDLDPGPGVEWPRVIEGAMVVRDFLALLGLESFVKTSGGKGLHVVAPLVRRSDWAEVKSFARAVAERIARTDPHRYIAEMSKARRRGKIYIDYLRNDRGATSIAPYSTRARNGAPVSTPLSWDELSPAIGPDYFTVDNLPARLDKLVRDPWEGFFGIRQSITAGMRRRLNL